MRVHFELLHVLIASKVHSHSGCHIEYGSVQMTSGRIPPADRDDVATAGFYERPGAGGACTYRELNTQLKPFGDKATMRIWFRYRKLGRGGS